MNVLELNYNILLLGDWVNAYTSDGELIHGYIETLDFFREITQISVVSSDNKDIIGKVVSLDIKDVKKIPISTKYFDAQLIDLIDIALLTKDKKWFIELSENLKSTYNQKQANQDNNLTFYNRV